MFNLYIFGKFQPRVDHHDIVPVLDDIHVLPDLAQAAVLLIGAAVIASDGPAPLVYAIVVVATMISVPFRPAQAALLPRLARNPAELTAANVASSTIESVASFVGPALEAIRGEMDPIMRDALKDGP